MVLLIIAVVIIVVSRTRLMGLLEFHSIQCRHGVFAFL